MKRTISALLCAYALSSCEREPAVDWASTPMYQNETETQQLLRNQRDLESQIRRMDQRQRMNDLLNNK